MAVGSGHIVRATADFVYDNSSRVQNVFYLRNTGTSIAEADALDDLVSIIEALYQLLGGILMAVQVLQNLRVVNVTTDTDVGNGTFVDSTPGVEGGVGEPQQVAYGLTLYTARLRVRGRKFFGIVPNNEILGSGILTTNALTALADVGDYMSAPQTGPNNTWEFGVEAGSDGAWLAFSTYSISPTAVTQRRRRRGIGI